jgi:hypothetical protein
LLYPEEEEEEEEEEEGNTIFRNVSNSRYVVVSEKVYTFSSTAVRTANS